MVADTINNFVHGNTPTTRTSYSSSTCSYDILVVLLPQCLEFLSTVPEARRVPRDLFGTSTRYGVRTAVLGAGTYECMSRRSWSQC